jgi:large subunit ribosomal protein L32e
MTTEIKRLIRVRVEKGATFKRDGFGKKRQLSDSWRKPRGQHNKQREQKKAKGALPKPGFGSPIAVRGMHPSGFFEALVTSAKDLAGLDPKTQAVRIAAGLGSRKRASVQEAAIAAGLKILNARTITIVEKKPVKTEENAKDTEKSKKETKPEKSKAKTEPVKKTTKEKKSAAESGKKSAPVKSETKPAKPKAEKAEGKQESAKSKSSEKSTVKPAKPKAEKPAKSQDKPKAGEAKSKPPAKKTKSGVKKNE